MNFLKECWRLWSSKHPEITKIKYSNSDTGKFPLILTAGKQTWRQVKTPLWEDDLFLEEESAQLPKQWGIPLVNEAENSIQAGAHKRDILLPQILSRTTAPKSWFHFNLDFSVWVTAGINHSSLLSSLKNGTAACANIPLHPGSMLFSPACWPENNSSNCCQIKQTR